MSTNETSPSDDQIVRLFEALVAAEELLTIGRSDGLVVGLSPALAAMILHRHGERATIVVNDTWRVDPMTERDPET